MASKDPLDRAAISSQDSEIRNHREKAVAPPTAHGGYLGAEHEPPGGAEEDDEYHPDGDGESWAHGRSSLQLGWTCLRCPRDQLATTTTLLPPAAGIGPAPTRRLRRASTEALKPSRVRAP